MDNNQSPVQTFRRIRNTSVRDDACLYEIECLSTITKHLPAPNLDKLRESCFGKLFELPASKCPNSGKLIHNLLCRQLVTNKKHELWFVFSGKPFRFSLTEFGRIFGLPYGNFPAENDIKAAKSRLAGETTYYATLFSTKSNVTLSDILEMLQNEPDMPDWKRFRLALLIIVDRIIICSSQYRKITPHYVEWLRDVNFFLAYPWDRESFTAIIRRMTVAPKKKGFNSYTTLKQRLSHKTSHGFPLSTGKLAIEALKETHDSFYAIAAVSK